MPTLPEWHIEWADIAVAVGALILIGVAVLGAYKVVNPIAKKANRIAEFILGRPKDELGPAKPSLAERLDGQDKAIAAIEKQVTPNGGGSAHDKITRRIGNVDAKVDALFAHLGIEPPPTTLDPIE